MPAFGIDIETLQVSLQEASLVYCQACIDRFSGS